MNWTAGMARLSTAAKRTYIGVAVLCTVGYLAIATWQALEFARLKGVELGSPLEIAGNFAAALALWAVIWTVGYFVLKYLLRGLRWAIAGFAAEAPN